MTEFILAAEKGRGNADSVRIRVYVGEPGNGDKRFCGFLAMSQEEYEQFSEALQRGLWDLTDEVLDSGGWLRAEIARITFDEVEEGEPF